MTEYKMIDTVNVPTTSGIYAIKNTLNNKMYIGSTACFKTRWRRHRQCLRGGYHHSLHLQRSYDKLGESRFVFIILEECENIRETLILLEQKYMDELRPDYNIRKIAQFHFDGCTEKQKISAIETKGKAIDEFDLNGSFVKKWNCMSDASRNYNISVSNIAIACKSKQHQTCGKLFFYSNTVTEEYVKDFCNKKLYKKRRRYPDSHALKQQHSVNQYDMDGNFIKRWDSIKEAAKTLGIKSKSNIVMCCQGRYKHCKHFIWRYAE